MLGKYIHQDSEQDTGLKAVISNVYSDEPLPLDLGMRFDITMCLVIADDRGEEGVWGVTYMNRLREQIYIDRKRPNIVAALRRIKASNPEFPSEQQKRFGTGLALWAESEHTHMSRAMPRWIR